MTDDLVKQWQNAVAAYGLERATFTVPSAHLCFMLDRIDALTAERDEAKALAQTRLDLARAEGVWRVEQFERAEAAEAERDRLREALKELLEVSGRAVRLSVEHDNFKLYAMEPMEHAILLSRAALKEKL